MDERVKARLGLRFIRCLIIPCATVAAACVLVLAGREPVLSAIAAIADFLVIQDALPQTRLPQPVVIHVIAGPDDRTDYAIQLYKQRYALGERPTILFTGGWCTFHGYYHGAHGKERAEAQGVPPESIAIDEAPVTSTYDEVARVKEFVGGSPIPIRPAAGSVIVVSDPFHMRRANWTYLMLLGRHITLKMAPIPFGVSTLQRRWWTDAASRTYVKEEYLKLVYYLLRYRLNLGPVQRWLASLDRE